MSTEHTIFDWSREARTGVPEAVFAAGKTPAQLRDIIELHQEKGAALLLTRISEEQVNALTGLRLQTHLDAKCATLNAPDLPADAPEIIIVTAGTSDLPVALEAQVSAEFMGLKTRLISDVGVAGLWRLEAHLPALSTAPLIIAVAGMEGAIFPVLAGLVAAPIIAVPTSVGYGVAKDGAVALGSALSCCAPGVLTVNIDNGFGAAAAAAKILRMSARNS